MTESKRTPVDLGRVLSLSSLATLITMAIGGAVFAFDIKETAEDAVEEIVEVKAELKEMRIVLTGQTTQVTLIRQEQNNMHTRADRFDVRMSSMADRLRQVELDLKGK